MYSINAYRGAAAIAIVVASVFVPSPAAAADDSLRPLPIGEITGSPDGKATFRLGLSWREVLRGEYDYVVSPSLDVATADGRANLLTVGGNGVADININAGISVSFIRTMTDATQSAIFEIRGKAAAATDREVAACVQLCDSETEDRNKEFCKNYAPDPLRDKVIDDLKAWRERLGEMAWNEKAKRDSKADPAQVKSGAEILQRAIDINESTKHSISRRAHNKNGGDGEADKAVEKLRKALSDLADATPSAEAPSAEEQIAGVDAALLMLSDIYRTPREAPVVRAEQLCPSGRDNAEQATAALEYPAWWIEPSVVSFAVRGGANRGEYYASESGQDALNRETGKYGNLLAATSFGWLLVPEEGAAGRKATGIVEGVMGYEYQRNPAKDSIEWCIQPGGVAIDGMGGLAAAESCSRGVFGSPVPMHRFSAGLFGGAVFTRSGALKAELGATWSTYRRGDAPRGNDLMFLLPLSLNAGGKEFEKQKFRGVVRIAPTVRFRWQKEVESDPSSRVVPTFMLTVQLLGQRSFWGDALSWW